MTDSMISVCVFGLSASCMMRINTEAADSHLNVWRFAVTCLYVAAQRDTKLDVQIEMHDSKRHLSHPAQTDRWEWSDMLNTSRGFSRSRGATVIFSNLWVFTEENDSTHKQLTNIRMHIRGVINPLQLSECIHSRCILCLCLFVHWFQDIQI